MAWDQTHSGLSNAWISNAIAAAYSVTADAEAKKVPPPPSICELPDGAKKTSATNAHYLREKNDRLKEMKERVDKKFKDMLKGMVSDVYPLRKKNAEATAAYDKSMLEWRATKSGPEPSPPVPVTVDTLAWEGPRRQVPADGASGPVDVRHLHLQRGGGAPLLSRLPRPHPQAQSALCGEGGALPHGLLQHHPGVEADGQ